MALQDMLQGDASGSAPQGDPAQAAQELDTLIQVVSGIKDEATYQDAVKQYVQMGGDPSDLSEHFDKNEVAQMLQMLMQAKQELAAKSAPQQPAAPMSGVSALTGGA